MTLEEFWEIVEKVHRNAKGDMDTKCQLLEAELEMLPPPEIAAWDHHYDQLRDAAYSWDLWGVAYIYDGGCSDDGFLDFRSTLVSCGRSVFEKALRDPDSLADYDDSSYLLYEGYQYVAPAVYERLTGQEIPYESHPHPKPSGTDWTEDDLPKRFPRMAARYGFE